MKSWFYCEGEKQIGPVSEEKLIGLLRSGEVDADVLVWTEGQADWVSAMTVESLVAGEAETRPSPGTPDPMPAIEPVPRFASMADAWAKSELLEVAKYQKYIQWLVVANLVAMLIPLASIATSVVGVYFVYKLAKSLRTSGAVVYAILLFVPLIGLLTLVHFVVKATKVLRANGIGVGVMGARMADFEKMPG